MNQFRFELTVLHGSTASALRTILRAIVVRAIRPYLVHEPVQTEDSETFQLSIEDGDVIDLLLPGGRLKLAVVDGSLCVTVPRSVGGFVRTALGRCSMTACDRDSVSYSLDWRPGDAASIPVPGMGVTVRLTLLGKEWV